MSSPKMFNIHPKAQKNFDSKAEELIKRVKLICQPTAGSEKYFKPDLHSVGHITDNEIIGEVNVSAIDFSGNQVAFYFKNEQEKVGIEGDDYIKLRKLAESIFKLKEIRQAVSLKTVESLICEWIKNKYLRKEASFFTDYFLSKTEKLISEVIVWIPISKLSIEEPFALGTVFFRPITKELINKWIEDSSDNGDEKVSVSKALEKKFRPFQGCSAATMKLVAEKERAKEILIEEATKSLSYLSIFTGGALIPQATTFYGLAGTVHVDTINTLYLSNDLALKNMDGEIIGPPPRQEMLDKQSVLEIFQTGLGTIDSLLTSESISTFSTNVLDALLLYSRAASAKDVADKVIYILVALESILLKNTSEPIQQNLAERLACIIGTKALDRKKIISNVRSVYSVRSSFIHHGATINEFEVLSEFMLNAWYAVMRLISATDVFKSKEEFLNHIDDMKLSY